MVDWEKVARDLEEENKRLKAEVERLNQPVLKTEWQELNQRLLQTEKENERLRAMLGPLADHICLLCGKSEPCMTDEEVIAEGGPGAPCTFDPTPKELWEDNERLRTENERLRNSNAQRHHTCENLTGAIEAYKGEIKRLKAQVEMLSTPHTDAMRGE